MSFIIGQSVRVKDDIGVIKFIGSTRFAPGIWYGIELKHPRGRNNGSVQGVKYFDCKQESNGELYGVFVRENMLNQVNGISDKDSSRLNQIINKLQTKLKAVNQESTEYRNKFLSLQNEFDKKLVIISDLQSKLEMQNVDNDFLRLVKQELEEKLQELSIEYGSLSKEFELVKEELEVNREIEKEIELSNIDEFSPHDIKIIVERNRRLEDSLVLLTERSRASESRLQEELTILQKRITNSEELEKKLVKAESTIVMLQERIDTFADMEKMVERLTVENDELNTKIKNLTTAINELHEINELDKNLEEDMRQIESGLREDIEVYKRMIDEYQVKIEKLEDTVTKQIQEAEIQSSSDSTLNTSEAEFNSLRQSIANLKMKSRSDAVQLELMKNRYKVHLRRRITTADVSFRNLMNLIMTLKVHKLDLTTLFQAILDNNLHQRTIKVLLLCHSAFFQLLITLLEHNYTIENVDSTVAYIQNDLDNLAISFEKVNRILLDDDLANEISPELQSSLQDIDLFIGNCISMLGIGFYNFNYTLGTRECFRVLLSIDKAKGLFLEDVCNHVKLKLGNEKLKYVDDIFHISSLLGEYEAKVQKTWQGFDLTENIEFKSQRIKFAQHIDTSQLWEVYRYVSEDSFEISSELIEALQKFLSFVAIDYDFQIEKPVALTSSVYEYIVPVDVTNGNDGSVTIDRLQDVIESREREINDLRLNINLLEQNMQSLASQSSSKVLELSQTLDHFKIQEKKKLDVIDKLELEKKDLLKELDAMEHSSLKTIEFDNLHSQKEYNKTIAIIEKIIHLKNLAKDQGGTIGVEDSMWLVKYPKPKPIWNVSTPLQQLSRELRSIGLSIKPVPINPTNKYIWKKLTEQPKFMNLIHEERYAKYNSIKKSNLFSDHAN